MKTIIPFTDEDSRHIATMEVFIGINPAGSNLVADTQLNIDSDNYFFTTTNDCHTCPKVSDLKCTDDNEHSDEGEWDMMSAELKNGHKIAIKYKRKYYSFQSTQPDEQCKKVKERTSKS